MHAERNVRLPSTAALADRRGPLDSLRETFLPNHGRIIRKPLPWGESRGPHITSRAKPRMRDLQGEPLEL